MFSNIEICPIMMVLEPNTIQDALNFALEDGIVPIFTVKGEDKKELVKALKPTLPPKTKIKEFFVCIRFRENYFV